MSVVTEHESCIEYMMMERKKGLLLMGALFLGSILIGWIAGIIAGTGTGVMLGIIAFISASAYVAYLMKTKAKEHINNNYSVDWGGFGKVRYIIAGAHNPKGFKAYFGLDRKNNKVLLGLEDTKIRIYDAEKIKKYSYHNLTESITESKVGGIFNDTLISATKTFDKGYLLTIHVDDFDHSVFNYYIDSKSKIEQVTGRLSVMCNMN